ncbi:MAG: hypothetical protein ACLPH3_25030 [Terracidiphilus sp.]
MTRLERLLLPVILLLGAQVAREQDAVHVAPLEQCRADADAWGIPGSTTAGVANSAGDEFNRFKSKMDIGAVPSIVLNTRNDELMQCVDTDRLYGNRYAVASLIYKMAMFERMGNFMGRHNLVSQFYEEDDQGKR